MDYVFCTIYYDGQFWKALVEKIEDEAGGLLPNSFSVRSPQIQNSWIFI